jgi:acetyl esterase/lipase
MRWIGILIVLMVSLNAHAGVIRDWFAKKNDGQSQKLIDLAYGTDKKQKIDVYLPVNPKNAPIIVMVHGGAWKMGDKGMSKAVDNKVARWVPKGAIVVSVNYRLLPSAKPLEQAQDVARALAYVQNHALSWGGDSSKVILMGHSAGAHLVSLISSSPKESYALGVKPWLGTISLDTAMMNVVETMERKHYDFYDDAFGVDKNYWIQNSPFYQLDATAPPMLMICSTKREDKPCEESKPFMAKGKKLGLRMEMSEQALSHGEINDELGLPNDYTQRVEQFMASLGVVLN